MECSKCEGEVHRHGSDPWNSPVGRCEHCGTYFHIEDDYDYQDGDYVDCSDVGEVMTEGEMKEFNRALFEQDLIDERARGRAE